jgi:Trp operon repressor
MKKLSDIGIYWAAESDLACAWAEALDDDTIKSRVGILLTPAERRELVRRVWHIAQEVVKAEHANLGQILTFEQYCEEQGL